VDRPLPSGRSRTDRVGANADAFLTFQGRRWIVTLALGVQDGFEMTEASRRSTAAARGPGGGRERAGDGGRRRRAAGAFFDDLTSAGWRVAQTMAFPDHHAFTRATCRIGAARAAVSAPC
jgi:hypothetical protein